MNKTVIVVTEGDSIIRVILIESEIDPQDQSAISDLAEYFGQRVHFSGVTNCNSTEDIIQSFYDENPMDLDSPYAEPDLCRRCGSDVENGYCLDETCPYSSWPQKVEYDDMTELPTALLEEKYEIKRRCNENEANWDELTEHFRRPITDILPQKTIGDITAPFRRKLRDILPQELKDEELD